MQGMRPDPFEFAGGSASISAFSDPSLFPPEKAAALIDAAMGERPDAEQVKAALMERLAEPSAPTTSSRWQDMVASPQPRGGARSL